MFGMGWPELLVIGVVAFFVLGPERLPNAARDAARMIRQLRTMAQGMSEDLKAHMPEKDGFGLDDFREVRDEFRDLRDLHPRRLVSKALLDEGDEPAEPTVTTAGRTLTPGAVPPYDVDAT